MTPLLQFGQIVWAEVMDANGISKVRPAVILTPTERIPSAVTLETVAITSRLDRPLPADQVLLPWHPQSHPRTGLKRKSAAVCSWVARIQRSAIRDVAGVVPGPILHDILSRIEAYRTTPGQSATDATNGSQPE